MEKFAVSACIVILVSYSLLEPAFAEVQSDGKSLNSYAGGKPAAVWFGPRLGRKKRNPGDDYLRAAALEGLADILEDTPWSIVAMNEGKRRITNFTPRLGRDSGEDLLFSEENPDYLYQRGITFTPRLGRQLVHFPHIGRDTN